MRSDWESPLERWLSAGILSPGDADRIRAWERDNARPDGMRWPAWLALACGGILVCAGVLLFVSAHWDQLSPAERMSLTVLMVAVFHAGGAWSADRFPALATTLHTIGTIAMGAGIAVAGQIFNLQEHWPSAVLLWALGAAGAWLFLRDWTQALLAAILFPYWLAGEWVVRYPDAYLLPVSAGICALSVTYLTARRTAKDSVFRKALGWLGCIALLPAAALLSAESWTRSAPFASGTLGWFIALLGPLAVAVWLRGREAIWNACAIPWIVALAAMNHGGESTLPAYAWCAIGAVGLAAWGIRDSRAERINLGIAGFFITVLAFYFSSVMDKFGRSVSLMGLGVLFLAGGWLLEKTRRRLIAQIRRPA